MLRRQVAMERLRVEEERLRVKEERLRVEEEWLRVEEERLRVEEENLRMREERLQMEEEEELERQRRYDAARAARRAVLQADMLDIQFNHGDGEHPPFKKDDAL